MPRQGKQDVLPVILPPWAHRELELWGRSEERDAIQQARWVLKRVLAAHALGHGRTASERDDDGAVGGAGAGGLACPNP